jgi:hypothetical protein
MLLSNFQFAHCLKCQYELTGLGVAGKCPECGQRYSLTTGFGTMEGVPPEVKLNHLFRAGVTWVLVGIASLVMLIGVGLLLAGHHQLFWSAALLSGLLLAGAAANHLTRKL